MLRNLLGQFLLTLWIFSWARLAGEASAGEAYYLLMFGSQRTPANPNYSHTWATFVRVSWPGDAPCPSGNAFVEPQTISWLPANLIVRTCAPHPECGHNFELHETLRVALGTEQRVSMWGPYPIDPDLYYRALRRQAVLESGQVLYKANDMGYRSDRVSNCIHGVSSIADGSRLRVASPGWGESASFFVLLELERWVYTRQPEPWVGSALGLDCYPIIYRDWGNPHSNAVCGPVLRLFGGERGLQPSYGPPVR